jgi:metal-responsive CopG/Arc/MetJ family transcriptional regulator
VWSTLWSRIHSVETIQVVLDSKLLAAADGAARRLKVNRSELFRSALREYLKRLRSADLERRDREGYAQVAEDEAGLAVFDGVARWPDE